MPIRPVTPPLWENTLDLTAATIPPGATLTQAQTGAGGGTVTNVTATAPIASSGGTAPNISLNNSAVTPGSYGDATHVATVTVDAHGLVTAASAVPITGFTPNAITALSGDGTATGPGAAVFTLNAGQRRYYGTAAGTNTYTTTATPTPSAYTTGDLYVVTFTNANTGAATLNANTLGPLAIQQNGAALTGGEIPAGSTLELLHDGTQLQIVGSAGNSGTVTSVSVVTANGVSGSVATPTTTPAITLQTSAVTFSVTKVAHGFIHGNALSFAGGNWVRADITDPTKSCDALVVDVPDVDHFVAQTSGKVTLTTGQWDSVAGTTGGLTASEFYALGAAGTITSTPTGAYEQILGRAISATEFLIDRGDMVSLGANAGLSRIGRVVCSGSQTVITFSNIPQYFSDLRITFAGRATGAVGSISCRMRFNGDSTSGNYLASRYLTGLPSSAATGGTLAAAATGGYVFDVAGSLNATNPNAVATVEIPAYASALQKGFASQNSNVEASSDGIQIVYVGGHWKSTAAITQIEITIGSGSFLDGSICTLYGVG